MTTYQNAVTIPRISTGNAERNTVFETEHLFLSFFRYLNLKDTLAMRQVCGTWKALIDKNLFFKQFPNEDRINLMNAASANKMASIAHNLFKEHFSNDLKALINDYRISPSCLEDCFLKHLESFEGNTEASKEICNALTLAYDQKKFKLVKTIIREHFSDDLALFAAYHQVPAGCLYNILQYAVTRPEYEEWRDFSVPQVEKSALSTLIDDLAGIFYPCKSQPYLSHRTQEITLFYIATKMQNHDYLQAMRKAFTPKKFLLTISGIVAMHKTYRNLITDADMGFLLSDCKRSQGIQASLDEIKSSINSETISQALERSPALKTRLDRTGFLITDRLVRSWLWRVSNFHRWAERGSFSDVGLCRHKDEVEWVLYQEHCSTVS